MVDNFVIVLPLDKKDKNKLMHHQVSLFLSTLKADFFSSQKPLAASKQVLASSQNNFLSSHLNEHRPGWYFKQRQLNQAITITLRLTEHANIFLNTYPVVVFSDLSLQPLLPCTRSQQCFTTATIPSGSAILNTRTATLLHCDLAFTRCEQQIS